MPVIQRSPLPYGFAEPRKKIMKYCHLLICFQVLILWHCPGNSFIGLFYLIFIGRFWHPTKRRSRLNARSTSSLAWAPKKEGRVGWSKWPRTSKTKGNHVRPRSVHVRDPPCLRTSLSLFSRPHLAGHSGRTMYFNLTISIENRYQTDSIIAKTDTVEEVCWMYQ